MKCCVCGEEEYYLSKCKICDKHVCHDDKHVEYFGEYNECVYNFCSRCWELGGEQRELLKNLDEEYEKRKDEYMRSWEEKCEKK